MCSAAAAVVVVVAVSFFAEDQEQSKVATIKPEVGQKISLACLVYSQEFCVSNFCLPSLLIFIKNSFAT